MPRFLIDVNLPYWFALWNNSDYVHLRDIDETWSDDKVWDYASANNLVIITKDADFSIKLLYYGPPPKVIHIRFGNLKIKAFHERITAIWDEVVLLIEKNDMVNIYADRIEAIN